MLDHLLGSPSSMWKRIEALCISYMFFRLLRGKSGLKILKTLDESFSRHRVRPSQIVILTLLCAYLAPKISLLLTLNSPEPYAGRYNRNFYRATWIVTALDAGFATAMKIKPVWLRDICSIGFSLFYLVFANLADYKMRRIRNAPTLELMRFSWEKQSHPLIRLSMKLMAPPVLIAGRIVHIGRQEEDYGYTTDPRTHTSRLYLYFHAAAESCLQQTRQIIFFMPGGGFIAMNPTHHSDYLTKWAYSMPNTLIVAVDYAKAPEYAYPYSLEECFSIYKAIATSNGECIGIGSVEPNIDVYTFQNGIKTHSNLKLPATNIRIVIAGDSAGGGLAVGLVTKIIQHNMKANENSIPLPTALVLIYPCLSIDSTCWLTKDQRLLLYPNTASRISSSIKVHRYFKNPSDSIKGAPLRINVSDGVTGQLKQTAQTFWGKFNNRRATIFDEYGLEGTLVSLTKPPSSTTHYNHEHFHHALSLTSRIAFFNDRILSQETLRALALLYLGHEGREIDLHKDFLLSPILTPDSILAMFPRTYLICGDKDPLLDDSVLFGGRLREAALGSDEIASVALVEGVSHGFLNMMAFLPEAKECSDLIVSWFKESLVQYSRAPIVRRRQLSLNKSIVNYRPRRKSASPPPVIEEVD